MFPFVHHHVPGVLKSLLIPASHIPSLDLFPFGHCSASDQQTPPCDTIRSQKIIFLNQESPQWLLPQYHPATRSDLERQESIISPVSQVAGTGKGSDLFEVVPQGWGTGRKRSREFWLPVPLHSVSGNQPSAHKLLQVQERPRLLQQTWLPASWRKRAHMGSS